MEYLSSAARSRSRGPRPISTFTFDSSMLRPGDLVERREPGPYRAYIYRVTSADSERLSYVYCPWRTRLARLLAPFWRLEAWVLGLVRKVKL